MSTTFLNMPKELVLFHISGDLFVPTSGNVLRNDEKITLHFGCFFYTYFFL